MLRVRSWLPLVLACASLAGCRHAAAPSQASAPTPEAQPSSASHLQQLARYLTGSFSSAAQSQQDSRFYDIRLHMTPIWQERTDGPWLYVEQILAKRPDKPYRQRIYRLRTLPDGRLENQVFFLPGDALPYAGAWQKPELLAALSPEQLVLREGCSITLTAEGEPPVFRGSTSGQACPSDYRGAAYSTSEVNLQEGVLLIWDRGFDAQGKQLWGSEHGPYRFERVPAGP